MATKVRLHKDEMAALAEYEPTLTAALCDWLRPAGKAGNDVFRRIFKRVTGQDYTAHGSCGHCELTLARAVAEWWDATKKANETKGKK